MSIPNLNFGESTKKNVDILNNVIDTINEPGRNFLDNPNFKINQRGLGEYTFTAASYGIDRWMSFTNNTKISVLESGIKVSSVSSDGNPSAIIQNIVDFDQLKGKYVTLTVSIRETTSVGNQAHIRYVDESGTNQYGAHILHKTDPGVYHRSMYIPEQVTAVYVQIYGADMRESGEEIGNYTVFDWVKLEIGNVPTPFYPPNSVEELLKIQSMNDDGTPRLVSNDTLPSIMNSRMVSNPNLLDNPDFKINQRGLSEYTASVGYTVDRWYIGSGDSTSVTVTDDGLKVASTSSNNAAFLCQEMHDYENFNGRTCTISAYVNELCSVKSRILILSVASGNTNYNSLPITSVGLSTLTFNIPEGLTRLAVWLYGADSRSEEEAVGSYTVFKWVKMEFGPVATLFCPPNPASEIVKCQRYYYKFKHQTPSDKSLNCTIGEAWVLTSTMALAIIPVPTMRNGTYATVSYNNVVLVNDSGATLAYSAVNAIEQTDSTVQLAFIISGSATVGSRYRVRLNGTDSYLSLSKDL